MSSYLTIKFEASTGRISLIIIQNNIGPNTREPHDLYVGIFQFLVVPLTNNIIHMKQSFTKLHKLLFIRFRYSLCVFASYDAP